MSALTIRELEVEPPELGLAALPVVDTVMLEPCPAAPGWVEVACLLINCSATSIAVLTSLAELTCPLTMTFSPMPSAFTLVLGEQAFQGAIQPIQITFDHNINGSDLRARAIKEKDIGRANAGGDDKDAPG